jgi:hypothetical protein
LNSIPDWIVFVVPWVIHAAAKLTASANSSKRRQKGKVIDMKLKGIRAGAAESG